jgi:hypothetical protein
MKIKIISMARTGSNYLFHLFRKYLTTDYLLINEPFSDTNMKTYNKKYVNKIIKSTIKHKNIILKSHINQFYNIQDSRQIDFFLNSDDWYSIMLLRKDLFKCCLSHTVAHIIGNFGDKMYEDISLTIDPDIFDIFLNSKLNNLEIMAKHKTKNKSSVLFYYEDFTFIEKEDLSKFNLDFNSTPVDQYNRKRTPYNLIKVVNESKLYGLYSEKIKNDHHPLLINNNGLLEIK